MFKKMLSARGMGQVLSVFAALIVMIIVFALINPLFFSATNITNLLRQVARPHNCRNRPLNRLGRGNVVHDKRDADDKI